MTGYNLRFLESLRVFRDRISSGMIGRVVSVRTETGQYLPSWRPARDYRDTVSAQAALGGGVLMELSHEIDYLRWLFGDIKAVNATLLRQSSLEIDVEDTAHLLLTFDSPAAGAAVVASVNLDFVRRDSTRGCTAIGERGSLRWDAIADTVQVYDEPTRGWAPVFEGRRDPQESYLAEWRHFLECIEFGRVPLVSGEDGLAALRVVEGARQSSSLGANLALA